MKAKGERERVSRINSKSADNEPEAKVPTDLGKALTAAPKARLSGATSRRSRAGTLLVG